MCDEPASQGLYLYINANIDTLTHGTSPKALMQRIANLRNAKINHASFSLTVVADSLWRMLGARDGVAVL
jgi:hypothetical protein